MKKDNKTESELLHWILRSMLKLIHELQVHQIELELQNKELILAKEQSRGALQNLWF